MLQSMDDATDRQQFKFSRKVIVDEITKMLKEGRTHLFYPATEGDRLYRPGLLVKHLGEMVYELQGAYRGELVASRTPGGIVVDKI
jgi:hypothetical protein